jgi:hypothetical protein
MITTETRECTFCGGIDPDCEYCHGSGKETTVNITFTIPYREDVVIEPEALSTFVMSILKVD